MTIEADIIKQKLPETNGGYNAITFGKTHKKVYSDLSSDHPIDLTRYQLANCYMGRAGLINSGGASSGESDLKEAVKTSVINKRAGGMGLISGRKAFQRPMKEGVALLNAIQDVYSNKTHHGRVNSRREPGAPKLCGVQGGRCSRRGRADRGLCSCRDPDTRSTKNSRSSRFAASARTASRFSPPVFCTIAALRIRILRECARVHRVRRVHGCARRAGARAPISLSARRRCLAGLQACVRWIASVTAALLRIGSRRDHRFRSGRRRRAARFYAPFLAAFLCAAVLRLAPCAPRAPCAPCARSRRVRASLDPRARIHVRRGAGLSAGC